MATKKSDADNGATKQAGNGGDKTDDQNTDKTDNAGGYKPPATQAELDQIINDRIARAQTKFETDQKARAEKTEIENAKADLDKQKLENRLLAAENKFLATAGLAPDKAAKVFRLIKADLEFDDAGAAKNLDKLTADTRKEYPEFFAATGEKDVDQSKGGGEKDKAATGANSAANNALRGIHGKPA